MGGVPRPGQSVASFVTASAAPPSAMPLVDATVGAQPAQGQSIASFVTATPPGSLTEERQVQSAAAVATYPTQSITKSEIASSPVARVAAATATANGASV